MIDDRNDRDDRDDRDDRRSRPIGDCRSRDPLTFALVAGLLTVVAFAACVLPARKAGRVDPLIALRADP